MIQTYKQIKDVVNSYNNSTTGQYGQVQKLYSTPHLICIILRLKGHSKNLYLGRGSNFEGIWEHSDPPPSTFRIRDRFLEYLRKHLVGAKIGGLFLSPNDRILIIPYFKNNDKNFLGLFYKGRTLYFLNLFKEGGKNRLFRSWIGHQENFESSCQEMDILSLFETLEIGHADLEKEGPKSSVLEYFQKLNKDLEHISFSSKKKKFFERKEKKIEKDLEKLRVGQKIKDFLNNPNFLIGDKKEITISGVKFKFQKYCLRSA
jgi:predicted ribosome quality control (RQC) complex YloA/Tae2 family protein